MPIKKKKSEKKKGGNQLRNYQQSGKKRKIRVRDPREFEIARR